MKPRSYHNRGISAVKRLTQIFWNYRVIQKETLPYRPYRLWVEPTALCNLKCPYCPNQDLVKQEKLGYMKVELFKKVIDEARGWVYDINLHHRGESLLHPQLFDMVNYAGEKGVFTKLHTNATRMSERAARAILDSSLDLVSFSFDGFDKPTYENYRPPGKFEPTLENIMRFLRMKKEKGAKKPVTVFEVMDFPDGNGAFSAEKKRAFERGFDGLPLDKFIVKKPHNWAGNIQIDGTTGARTSTGFVPCTFLWHSLVVMWDGKVGPCPQDFMGKIILGDVSKQSLEEIFNGEPMVRLRRQMIAGKLEKGLLCNDCDVIQRKEVMGVPMPSLKYLRA